MVIKWEEDGTKYSEKNDSVKNIDHETHGDGIDAKCDSTGDLV